jgi:multidomain signaling protein FimX
VAQTSLKAVIEVAKAMKKKTIAKSVESAEALSVLWTFGVDYVQGYYFQEGDADLNYEFSGETTISSEASPLWTVESSGQSG